MQTTQIRLKKIKFDLVIVELHSQATWAIKRANIEHLNARFEQFSKFQVEFEPEFFFIIVQV